MSFITLTSDFGYQDHYAAAVKAAILKNYPGAKVIDITHGIEPFHIAQGAYTLRAVLQDFPVGTVHIFAIQGSRPTPQHIAFQWQAHYFVGPDNGFLGLLTAAPVEACVRLEPPVAGVGTFSAQTMYAPAAARLSQGHSLHTIGSIYTQPEKLLARQPYRTGRKLMGHVIHVDHYGNLVTNITQQLFAEHCGASRFEIILAREVIHKLHRHYTEVAPGDGVALFNTLGLLEIAINQGHAAALLGLHYDSVVSIGTH